MKTISNVRVKNADLGLVEAVFSTFDVVDKDGDVTVKGAIPDGAEVIISAYGHATWKGALPVGKGVIRVQGDEAIIDGEFFMNTTHGRDTFEVVKGLGPKQEWSYSLSNVKAEMGEVDGRRVRILKSIEVREVSPVFIGAGIDTRTLMTKGASMKQLNSQISEALCNAGRERWGSQTTWVYTEDYDVSEGFAIYCISTDGAPERMVQVDYTIDDAGMATLSDVEVEVEEVTTYAPKGAKFSEHVKAVVAVVDGLTTRAQEVVALRAEKGKSLADESAVLLKQLDGSLGRLREVIDTPTTNTSAAVEYLRFVASTQGVTQ